MSKITNYLFKILKFLNYTYFQQNDWVIDREEQKTSNPFLQSPAPLNQTESEEQRNRRDLSDFHYKPSRG
jgi:hypothetical protein